MAAADARIREIVAKMVAERFDDACILSVTVEGDVDSDGEPILRVRVVFESDSGKLDAGKTSGLMRHLRPKLNAAGVEGFPLLSFISKSDAESISPEAA